MHTRSGKVIEESKVKKCLNCGSSGDLRFGICFDCSDKVTISSRGDGNYFIHAKKPYILHPTPRVFVVNPLAHECSH